MKTVQTTDGLEVLVNWTCPACDHNQDDTVHPELGPYFSSACGNCGRVFEDGDLNDADAEAWEQARKQAESMAKNGSRDNY